MHYHIAKEHYPIWRATESNERQRVWVWVCVCGHCFRFTIYISEARIKAVGSFCFLHHKNGRLDSQFPFTSMEYIGKIR